MMSSPRGSGPEGFSVNISEAIGRRSRAFVSSLALALITVAIVARYLIPPRFSVAFIFLLPVSFATWFLSWAAGAVIALAGVLFPVLLRCEIHGRRCRGRLLERLHQPRGRRYFHIAQFFLRPLPYSLQPRQIKAMPIQPRTAISR
jgi:hypothetical protein